MRSWEGVKGKKKGKKKGGGGDEGVGERMERWPRRREAAPPLLRRALERKEKDGEGKRRSQHHPPGPKKRVIWLFTHFKGEERRLRALQGGEAKRQGATGTGSTSTAPRPFFGPKKRSPNPKIPHPLRPQAPRAAPKEPQRSRATASIF